MAGDLLEQLRAALTPQPTPPVRQTDPTTLDDLMAFLKTVSHAYTPGPRESGNVEDRRTNDPTIPGKGLTLQAPTIAGAANVAPAEPPLLAKLREVLAASAPAPAQPQV